MRMSASLAYCILALPALVAAGCAPRGDSYAAQRRALVDRPRRVMWDDDGCDMTHYPIGHRELLDEPLSVRSFERVMLAATEGTQVSSIFYSGTMGFGYFTAAKAGDWFTNELADVANTPYRNKAVEYKERFGLDAMDMAVAFAKRNRKEIFAWLRFNDNHDAVGTWDKPFVMLSPFKRANPDCLVGMNPGNLPKCCGWAAADFAKEKVRAFCRQYVREYLENYDVDGIGYDFFRHPQLFASVARGGRASNAELDLMTRFMLDLKAIAEEVGRKRGRPFVIAVRVPDSVEYCRAIGIDLERWMRAKAFDFVVVGGYFQLRPWRESVALAHRHGMRCYASLDESRIDSAVRRGAARGLRSIPGRGTREFYAARAAAAMEQGMDGVFYFNLEYKAYDFQRTVLNYDLDRPEGVDKLYYATFVGGGGYMPHRFLVGGEKMIDPSLNVNPTEPVALDRDRSHRFVVPIGDDFAAARIQARVEVLVLTDLKDGARPPRVLVNRKPLSGAAFADGLYTFAADAGLFAKGDNEFVVTATDRMTLNDFAVRVTWGR